MFGQQPKHALVFKNETGGVFANQTHHSANNEYKYSCFYFADTLSVDSQGHQIKIYGNGRGGILNTNLRQNIAIIKYDVNFVYQYHWVISTAVNVLIKVNDNVSTIYSEPFSLCRWSNENKVYFSGTCSPTDSFVVFDKYNKPTHAFYPSNLFNKQVSFSLAINIYNNQVEFCNLFWVNNLHSLYVARTFNAKFINATTNQFEVYLDMDTLGWDVVDTLSVWNNNNINTYKLNKRSDLQLTFDHGGNLLNWKNDLYLQNNDNSKYITLLKSIKQQNYLYSFFKVYSPTNDTLVIQNNKTIAVNDSFTFFFVKHDSLNRLVWVKPFAKTNRDFEFDFCKVGNNRLAFYIQRVNNTNPITWLANFSQIPHNHVPNIFLFDTSITQLKYRNISARLVSKIYNNGCNDELSIICNLSNWNYSIDGIAPQQLVFPCFGIYKFDSNLVAQTVQQIIWDDRIPSVVHTLDNWIMNTNHFANSLGSRYSYSDGEIVDQQNRTFITGLIDRKWFLDCGKEVIPVPRPTFGNYTAGVIFIFDAPGKIIDTSVCYGLLSPSGKYFYNTSGQYTDTIQAGSCDSIIKLRVFVKNSFSNIDTSVCYKFVTPSKRYTFFNDTTFTDTIGNASQCDSLITFRIQVKSTLDTLNMKSCKPIVSPSGKFTFTFSGTYLDTLINNNGCDSVLVIHYKYLSTIDTISLTSCNSRSAPSNKFDLTITGQYLDTLINRNGCDSILVINYTQSNSQLNITKSNDISCDSPITFLSISPFFNNIKWEPRAMLSNNNYNETSLKSKNTQTVFVEATDTLGCLFFDTILVNVNISDSLFETYNVVTPNNDGKNDEFNLQISKFNIIEMNFVVYDRWGNLLFETNTPIQNWNVKTNSGLSLTDGVYYYHLNAKTSCDTYVNRHGIIHVINN